MSRQLRFLIAAIGMAALAWLLLSAFDRALSLGQRFMGLPAGMRWLIGILMLVLVAAGIATGVWWLRPRTPRAPVIAPDRASLESRIATLRDAGADVEEIRSELGELDRRQATQHLYVAVFGEVSTGKSTLVGALVPGSTLVSDVRGGTTRDVAHYEGLSPRGEAWIVADVPGTAEADGDAREVMACDEALRAHAVIYVCAGDLTRTQGDELRWLGDFGKPLVLAINKADQWDVAERASILKHVAQQAAGLPDAVVAISAGGQERFTRRLADGRTEQVVRERHPDLDSLLDAVARLVSPGAAGLEALRENAVLARVHERTGEREVAMRAAEAERIVSRYARRAIVGAMAAVAPGTDLVIQGALAAGLVRALADLHGVRVSDVDVDNLLKQARMTLRTGTSVVLAVAGNALKAFPGLGTLGGGILHAFAYALIFDSLGRALAATLAERHALDQADAGARMREMLGDASGSRLKRLAALTHDALQSR